VDEAGRPIEPPLTMAPPRREVAPEAENGATRAGIMAPPPKVDSEPTVDPEPETATGRSGVREEVPFPADNIGQAQGASGAGKNERAKDEPAKNGQVKDDAWSEDETRAKDDGRAKDDARSQDDGRAKDEKRVNGAESAPDAGKDADDDAAASSRGGNGVLEGGLQTVKQAVAATNSWFASRVAKAEPAAGSGETAAAPREDEQRDNAARREDTTRREDTSRRESAAPRPEWEAAASFGAAGLAASATSQSFGSADQSADVIDQSGTSFGAAGSYGSSARSRTTEGAGTPPPKWNDPYPSYSAPSQPPRTAPLGAAPLAPDPVRPSSPGSGPAPTMPPPSRGWSGKSSRPAVSGRRQKASAKRNRRQAHLTVARVEPWSVMKFSFVVSVVAFIILFVAVAILYAVLSSIGVFDSLQRVVTSVTSSQTSGGTNVRGWFSASKVLGYTGLLGSLNIVLITAMSTIGAVIYNLISRVFGGVEITLRETE
jgi:hypothetical protein